MSTVETKNPEDLSGLIPTLMPNPQADPHWLVKIEHVRKKYCRDLRKSLWYAMSDVAGALTLRSSDSGQLRESEFWAVDDVSFTVNRGDSLGLLGRNGAGKSTLLKMIIGKRSISAGTIMTRGRIVALTELGLGFNQALTGRENAYINAAVHGFTRKEFDKIFDEIVDFSGLREFIDSAVQTYSTGMKARLGFSIATHLNPDILVVDEVLAVGDLEFRRKCVRHILSYLRNGGSVILVAHDPYMIQSMCNRCVVLDKGKLIFDGSGIDGVSFHFEMGRNKQFANLSESQKTSQSGIDDRLAAAEAAELEDLAALPAPPGRRYTPLTPEEPIVVDDFEVVAVDGGPISMGKPAKVVMHYRALEKASIMWGFTICSSDMHTSIASFAKGMDGTPSYVEAGEGILECILPNLRLRPGVYGVRGGIGDLESLQALSNKGYRDAPHFFTVVSSDVSRTANYKTLNGAMVEFEAEWLS